jgi:hypothetical protein
MACYAVATRGGQVEVIAVWQDAIGRHGELLTAAGADRLSVLREVAANLEGLSESLWSSYADCTLDLEEARAGIHDMMAAPEWPQGGYVAAYFDPVHEYTARLARSVAACREAPVANAVAMEIERELDALARASLGDFSGRAGQATWRNRPDASPTQVAAAHEVLRRHAGGTEGIDGLSRLEPAAACAALIAWCVAAAEVYGRLARRPAGEAARAAAEVTALDAGMIDQVLHGVLSDGRQAVEVVADLLPRGDGRKLFAALTFGYFALWELIEQHVETDVSGAPLVGGRAVEHPRGADWAEQSRDGDEYTQAWHQAVEQELGRQIADAVRDEI